MTTHRRSFIDRHMFATTWSALALFAASVVLPSSHVVLGWLR